MVMPSRALPASATSRPRPHQVDDRHVVVLVAQLAQALVAILAHAVEAGVAQMRGAPITPSSSTTQRSACGKRAAAVNRHRRAARRL